MLLHQPCCISQPPEGVLLSSQVRRQLKVNQPPARACWHPGAGDSVCHNRSGVHRGGFGAVPTCAELSLSLSPKTIGQRISEQRVHALVCAQACACTGSRHLPRGEVVAVGDSPRHGIVSPGTRSSETRDSGVPPGVQGCSAASPVSLQGDRPAVPLTAERWHRGLLCKGAPGFGPAQYSPNHF